MKKEKVFAYVGTWPLKQDGLHPGLPNSGMDHVKTGIFGFLMNTETGDWTPTSNFYTSSMTSMLCATTDGKFLYSSDENRNTKGISYSGGGILAFAINGENGDLKFINKQSSMGAFTSFVEMDASNKYVFATNMGYLHEKFIRIIKAEDGKFKMTIEEEEGSIVMFRIREDGGVTEVIDMAGFRGANPKAQGEGFSHHHCVKINPSNNFLLTCDIGCDKIHVFRIDHANGKLVLATSSSFKTRTGIRPRFLVFHPTNPWFFVNNESNSTVYSFSFDINNGKIEELDYASSVFNKEDSTKSLTADIAVHKNGKYLYVSSRSQQRRMPNANCPPDTIAIFEINQVTGKLVLNAVTPVIADNPRGIAFDPAYKYLYITSLETNMIFRYTVDPDTGILSNPAVVANVPTPSSIKFVTIN